MVADVIGQSLMKGVFSGLGWFIKKAPMKHRGLTFRKRDLIWFKVKHKRLEKHLQYKYGMFEAAFKPKMSESDIG